MQLVFLVGLVALVAGTAPPGIDLATTTSPALSLATSVAALSPAQRSQFAAECARWKAPAMKPPRHTRRRGAAGHLAALPGRNGGVARGAFQAPARISGGGRGRGRSGRRAAGAAARRPPPRGRAQRPLLTSVAVPAAAAPAREEPAIRRRAAAAGAGMRTHLRGLPRRELRAAGRGRSRYRGGGRAAGGARGALAAVAAHGGGRRQRLDREARRERPAR